MSLWLRSILKRYAVSLLCFSVFGLIVLQLYLVSYDNLTNHWSVDPLPLPLALLAGLLGIMTYFPLLLFAGGAPMLLASVIFTFFTFALGFRARGMAWGSGAGAVSAVVAAAATHMPEIALTPMLWWQGMAQGCVLAGGVAGALAARMSQPGRSARTAVAAEARNDGRNTMQHRARMQLVATFMIAMLVTGAAMDLRQSSREDVRIRRDAERQALAFRAGRVDQQAASIAGLRTTTAAKISASDRSQSAGRPVVRSIQDADQLATEIASLRTYGGPPLSTRYQGFAPVIGNAKDGYSMLFIDQRAHGETRETLIYRLQGSDTVLTDYMLSYEGRGKDTMVKALYFSP